MEELIKKFQDLVDLIKAANTSAPAGPTHPPLPKIQAIRHPSAAPVKPTKAPGMNPNSKKDPKKIAEQLKNGEAQKMKMPLLKTHANGQWTLEE